MTSFYFYFRRNLSLIKKDKPQDREILAGLKLHAGVHIRKSPYLPGRFGKNSQVRGVLAGAEFTQWLSWIPLKMEIEKKSKKREDFSMCTRGQSQGEEKSFHSQSVDLDICD